ncbi:uracil-DNA glycosylase family protein [Pseudorhodobacter sp.]|uniref:uracil-DNA glycosylase family protein n=1 Tax=Pseudorhodobacter sp. TaxID=1934400 RepID=UPI00264A207A|nr:uracil-DNA glycosylase family protein [Pseudorhodobacter sp.]MDN5785762.1 uracil-DNA glycosylase family protein [Pseudorhodobacter sp.]
MQQLLAEVRACTVCKDLPLGPAPLLQASATARILIAGQAPGRLTHLKGIPFDDVSGNRLREWLGLDRPAFYDASKVAILPMGFCFPGTGKSGDLPPRAECAPLWRARLLAQMPEIALILVIGRYAMDWHLPGSKGRPIKDIAQEMGTEAREMVLPHPSPRNNRWLAKNPWFEADVLPRLRARVAALTAA